jgi:hypothetical protein
VVVLLHDPQADRMRPLLQSGETGLGPDLRNGGKQQGKQDTTHGIHFNN